MRRPRCHMTRCVTRSCSSNNFTLVAAGFQPWLIEIVAGIIEDGESSEDLVHREIREEAGLEATELEPIGIYLLSPGGTSETMHVFCARVDSRAAGGVFGLDHEGEDIRAFVISGTEVEDLLSSGARITNATSVIALQWFLLHHERLRRAWTADPQLAAAQHCRYIRSNPEDTEFRDKRLGKMDIRDGFIEAVGNTPMIRMQRAFEETGCMILGKAEFLNPAGSVKDRAALAIVKDAEEKGLLKPGGVIVEGTAGNTGIGLAHVANARGYRTVIVIPETQTQEKKDALRQAGAELIEVPAVPYKDPNNYVKYSGRLADELAEKEEAGAIWANQFDNIANRQGHFETTGPEIWDQTDGTVDGFICAVGTGGTLAGTGMYLKSKNADIKIGLADPMGAALYEYYTNGALKSSGSSITEGIGQGRITANLEGAPVDIAFQIPDEEALPVMYGLLREEGLSLGTSSGVNVAGAIRLAKELGPGHTIVTILCDGAHRYASKIFNIAFLKEKGLPFPEWLEK